jgi:hypothetical protein
VLLLSGQALQPVIDDVALGRHGYHLVGAGAITRAGVGSGGSDVTVLYWSVWIEIWPFEYEFDPLNWKIIHFDRYDSKKS